jgi:gliding motility associated protien GldN
MNLLNKIGLTFGTLLLSSISFAQNPSTTDPSTQAGNVNAEGVNSTWKPSLVKDGVIDVVPHVNRSLDFSSIREVDAAWKRRVWRQIDVRQKQNQAFTYVGDEYSGGGAFIEILLDAVKKGKVSAYNTFDDRFTEPLNMESFEQSLVGTSDSTGVIDPITGETSYVITKKEFNINDVTKYRLKEDWIFDRNAGRMVVRIVGIAPLIDRRNETTGDYQYSTPMFWLNYPDLRKVLANYEVYNPQNDLHRMSWADFFDGRYFASYVIKTSANNPSGADFEKNLRGLEEGERAVQTLRDKEDDMWQR